MSTNDKVEQTSDEEWDKTLNSSESIDMLEMLSEDLLKQFKEGKLTPLETTEEKPKSPKI